MALIQDRRAQAMDESLFVLLRNSSASVMSVGYPACYTLINVTSANGYDIEKPLTSNLSVFAGLVAGTHIGTQKFGMVQVYGYSEVAYVRFESTDGIIPEGTVLGPVNNQFYIQSGGRSFALGPVVLMSRHAAATFEGQTKVFVRAL